VLFHNRKIP